MASRSLLLFFLFFPFIAFSQLDSARLARMARSIDSGAKQLRQQQDSFLRRQQSMRPQPGQTSPERRHPLNAGKKNSWMVWGIVILASLLAGIWLAGRSAGQRR